jgi:peptidoglycan/xylan/chitin deacetylase (PgdA/CDA1 family)
MMAEPRVAVLMYHRVGSARNDWEARYAISPQRFAAHMDTLASKGYRAVEIEDFVKWLDGRATLPPGAMLVTFDDGFRGVRDHALPVMRALHWPFTVFLVSDLIGREDVWTRASNPSGVSYPLLDAAAIHDMQRQGVTFHSHTRTHPSLPTLDDSALTEELAGSRTALSELLGCDASYIAYPFGHLDERVERAARDAGYRVGFSTQSGFNRRDVNRFRIRRIDVYGTDTPAMLLRKLRLGTNDGSLAHAARYYVGRLQHRLGRGQAQ